ncbi:hypothetical protein MMC30_001458 [Trapelia coarctata]|nr:hypothetical protein [Trapelia coarctata]
MPLISEDPPSFLLQARQFRLRGRGQGLGPGPIMLLRVGNLAPEDAADALNTEGSTTVAFPTAKQFFDTLPDELYWRLPTYPGITRGTLDNFKAFIRDIALEGEDVEGKLSVPTQVAVLASLSLLHTRRMLFSHRREEWEGRQERQEHAKHYANFESDYGCALDCNHPDHGYQRNNNSQASYGVPDSPISDQGR